jgi:hypothetical protein
MTVSRRIWSAFFFIFGFVALGRSHILDAVAKQQQIVMAISLSVERKLKFLLVLRPSVAFCLILKHEKEFHSRKKRTLFSS